MASEKISKERSGFVQGIRGLGKCYLARIFIGKFKTEKNGDKDPVKTTIPKSVRHIQAGPDQMLPPAESPGHGKPQVCTSEVLKYYPLVYTCKIY